MDFMFGGHLRALGPLCNESDPLFTTQTHKGASNGPGTPPVLKFLIVIKQRYVFSYPENSFLTFCSLDLTASREFCYTFPDCLQ